MKITSTCIACGSSHLMRRPATIAPFVTKRVFGWSLPIVNINGQNVGLPSRTDSMYCNDCGMLFCDWRFDNGEMGRLYKDYRSAEYAAEREQFEPGYKLLNDGLGKSLPELHTRKQNLLKMIYANIDPTAVKKVLDYGGDEGQFIPDCFTGTERSVYDISGKPTVNGLTKLTQLSDGARYDFIMCCHVLEHCSWPREIVQEIKHHAARYIYVEVPLERDPPKVPDYADCYHEHINKFHEGSLRKLLEIENLRVLDLKVMEMTSVVGVTKNIMALCEV